MEQRLNPFEVLPDGYQAMKALERYVAECGLDKSLLALVKIRASQINGCAFCIAMHTTEARKGGESEQRIYLLNAWRDTSIFNARERAALAWTESMTLLADGHVTDELYAATRKQFSEAELINLTWVICAINSWNRICSAFRVKPVISK